MKKWVSLFLILSCASSLQSCSSTGSSSFDSSKTVIGLVSGALIGGIAGSALDRNGSNRATAVGIGAVVGGILGGGIGMVMDERDKVETKLPAAGDNAVVRNAEAKSNSWQHSTTTAAAAVKGQQPVAASKITQTATPETAEMKKKKDQQTKAEKLLTLLHKLPSTQWFFDDGNQVG